MKRSDFVEHVSWTGLGIVYTLGSTGIFNAMPAAAAEGFSFVQISDSHIGFKKDPNENPGATLKKAVDAINALPAQPKFVFHTGDVTHLTKPAEFDTAKQILSSLKAPLFVLPGEHDVIGTDGFKTYLSAFKPPNGADPKGWFSFDMNGVHFVALVNVFNFEKMGLMGNDQIDWLRKDLVGHKKETPVVVFGHVPLYALYEKWGWTTEDGSKAIALLTRFDNVTVLNGHIHQIIEKTEGNIRFRTAASTAYPQPAPGTADGPGPLKVPADKLLAALGYRTIDVPVTGKPALKDTMFG